VSSTQRTPARAALVLVDLQNAFCEPDGSVGRQGRDMTNSALAAEACIELATSLRAAGVPIIWTQYELRPDYADSGRAVRTFRPGMKVNEALHAGSWDADFWRPDEVRPEDFVLKKTRSSALVGTPLELLLRDLDVHSVYVAGLTTSMCVESTVRDLAQRDYDVSVVADATADFSAERQAASLVAMEFGFARLLTAEQVVEELSQPSAAPRQLA
jgi:nicotinamidase-related amidase